VGMGCDGPCDSSVFSGSRAGTTVREGIFGDDDVVGFRLGPSRVDSASRTVLAALISPSELALELEPDFELDE
jgi:hypothetical protein